MCGCAFNDDYVNQRIPLIWQKTKVPEAGLLGREIRLEKLSSFFSAEIAIRIWLENGFCP